MPSFKQLGQRIAAIATVGSNAEWDFVKQSAELCDVEHPNPEIREISTNFWRSFCHAYSEMEKRANGATMDYCLLRKLADTPIWVEEFQKMASVYANDISQGMADYRRDELTKEASFAAILPAIASRTAGVTPTAIKALLGAGMLTGAAAGGLYWGTQRAATEDDDKGLEAIQNKIDEYRKMKAMLSAEDGQFSSEEAGIQKKINKL